VEIFFKNLKIFLNFFKIIFLHILIKTPFFMNCFKCCERFKGRSRKYTSIKMYKCYNL